MIPIPFLHHRLFALWVQSHNFYPVTRISDTEYYVPSATGLNFYTVKITDSAYVCDCPAHRKAYTACGPGASVVAKHDYRLRSIWYERMVLNLLVAQRQGQMKQTECSKRIRAVVREAYQF